MEWKAQCGADHEAAGLRQFIFLLSSYEPLSSSAPLKLKCTMHSLSHSIGSERNSNWSDSQGETSWSIRARTRCSAPHDKGCSGTKTVQPRTELKMCSFWTNRNLDLQSEAEFQGLLDLGRPFGTCSCSTSAALAAFSKLSRSWMWRPRNAQPS
jgi:hypothetical protein